MSKCEFNAKKVLVLTNRKCLELRKGDLKIGTIKKSMYDFFKEVSDLFSITDDNVQKAADTIYRTLDRWKISERSPEFFNSNNILSILIDANAGILKDNPINATVDRIRDTEEITNRLNVSREFLDNAYGLAKEVLTYATNVADLNFYDTCFINRGSIEGATGLVRTNALFNDNLRNYLEILLRKITSYLNTLVTKKNLEQFSEILEDLRNPHLYLNQNGKYEDSGILTRLQGFLDTYLSSEALNADTLRLLYLDMNNTAISLTDRLLAKLKLDAYNAKVFLTHFDSYMTILFGDKVNIKDFGRKTGENKYTLANSMAKVYTTWRTSDNIDVLQEADFTTKLAINTTPLYSWGSSSPTNNLFLKFTDFSHIIAKIKALTYNPAVRDIVFNDDFTINYSDIWDNLSEDTLNLIRGKNLAYVINSIRLNPRRVTGSIFEILTNQDFYDTFLSLIYNSFTTDELNKLYSLGIGIFNPTILNSINSLSDPTLPGDFYSYITLTADSIFDVSFLQYYKDQDGTYKIRTLIDLNVNNIRGLLELSINSNGSAKKISSIEDFVKQYNIIPNTNPDNVFIGMDFTIPNTEIRGTVLAATGDVRLMLNGRTVDFRRVWNNENVRKFADNLLRFNLENDSDFLQYLIQENATPQDTYKGLLLFASRVLTNRYIDARYLTGLTNSEKEIALSEIFGAENTPRINYLLDEMSLVHSRDIPFLRSAARAKANLLGVTTGVQVKDSQGKSQNLSSLSRLLGALQTLYDLLERALFSATKDCIFLNTPRLFEGVFSTKEFYNALEGSKETTDWGVGEMSYSNLVMDYIGGLLPTDPKSHSLVGGGHVLFLPSVNSDKSTIGRIKINLNARVTTNGQEKSFLELTNLELDLIISKDLGNIYLGIFNNISHDWNILDLFLISKGWNGAISLTGDLVNNFYNFNQGFLALKERLLGLIPENIKSPVDFIKYAVREYNKDHRLNPLLIVDLIHYINGGGFLTFNQSLLSQLTRFGLGNYNNYPTYDEFWNNKRAEVLNGLLKSHFQINTTGTKLPELLWIRRNYPLWINASGNVILAKVNGKDVTSLNDIPGIDLDYLHLQSIELNPIIERYNKLDYLFTLEYMLTSVGTHLAHPAKGKYLNVLQEEAARYQALHKRNVSFTASMHEFLLGLLNGIPSDYNIAVVEDIKDYQGTIDGSINQIKPFDGATFVNPFVVYLENNSLGGAKVGITKKQFVHFKDAHIATAGIIKTAGFGLTNDWIRNSKLFLNMMWKMSHHLWLNPDGTLADVDILHDYKGSPIEYTNQYFKRGSGLYRIVSFERTGTNTYNRNIQLVRTDGSEVGPIIQENNLVIDNNYKLWEAFGGAWSLELADGVLKPSESSIKNVVTAMNNVRGYVINDDIRTLDDMWQPLKHSDVHYVVTAGAIKQGAANINSVSRYSDLEDYDILKIHMYQAGILLDKEHGADDEDIALMTLVMSACAERGYTFEAASELYKVLRIATDTKAGDHINLISDLFNTNSELDKLKVLDLVVKSIIKNLATSRNSSSFATIIAKDLIKAARNGLEILFSKVLFPLSDNNVFALVVSLVSIYLTKTGIKLKIPGVLAILTPSYNIMKLYAGRKLESYSDPDRQLLELLDLLRPLFTTSNPLSADNTVSNIELGRTYIVRELNDSGVWEENSYLINTPLDYYNLKDKVNNNRVSEITEDLRAGRDLAGYNCRFLDTDGTSYLLYDLDSEKALVLLSLIRNRKDLTNDQKVGLATNLYTTYFGHYPYNDVSEDPSEISLDLIERDFRRALLNDLSSISVSLPDVLNFYLELMSGYEDTNSWYLKYANWVNVYFGTGNGSSIVIDGTIYNTINSSNFALIQERVLNKILKSTQVKIDGRYCTINKNTIRILPYELILSKTAATAFGLNEFANLSYIKNDPDYFIKQFIRNLQTKVDEGQYWIELKKSNGNHIYVLPKDLLTGSELLKLDDDLIHREGNDSYRTDSKGNILYPCTEDAEIYVDTLGNEVIVTNSPEFYLDNLSYDSVKLSNSAINSDKLLNVLEYLRNSKSSTARKYHKYITSNGSGRFNVKLLNSNYYDVTLENYQELPDNLIVQRGREKYVSFLEYLKVIATRTPSLSMLSFMPMVVVAFNNMDTNTAFVSTYLILLLGSDYDIDTASIATYDINSNGILDLWSPYADLSSSAMLEASMKLPLPTGKELNILQSDELNDTIDLISQFNNRLFKINYVRVFNNETKEWDVDPNHVTVDVILNSPESLDLMRLFLSYDTIYKPTNIESFALQLTLRGVVFLGLNPTLDLITSVTDDIIAGLKLIIDRHNLYFDKLSNDKITRIINNRLQHEMYNISADPVNLIASLTPVDKMTQPLKRVSAEFSTEGTDVLYRTPGDWTNKLYSIVENLVGKKGIGICATGLKSYFGLILYNNYVLNHGTLLQQKRLLFQHTIDGKNYRTVANIRATNPNTITNNDVLNALANAKNDEDASLILSALLSLATDNAKELELAKLNAGTKTIGMYIYGITIGMDFRDIGRILMSRVGTTMRDLLEGNIFNDNRGLSSIQKVILYFEQGPYLSLRRFDKTRDSKGNTGRNPLDYFDKELLSLMDYYNIDSSEDIPVASKLRNFARSNMPLETKLEEINKLRSKYNTTLQEFSELYNQLLDYAETYILLTNNILTNPDYYLAIVTLSEGAEEQRRLGMILSYNQGLRTSFDDLVYLASLIENAIYDKTGKAEDIIDILRFVFDNATDNNGKTYRERCIDMYDTIKHTFNILDVIANNPHTFGYIRCMATSLAELSNTFKFRSVRNLLYWAQDLVGNKKSLDIARGLSNYIGDYLRKNWMLDKGIQITIPAGQKIFDKYGNESVATSNQIVTLGTDWGDATFRAFFENKIIPDLKLGKISPNVELAHISSNRFISDLSNNVFTNTISRNPTVAYTLPINMLPRTDVERALFNLYKSEFNNLAQYSYSYNADIVRQLENEVVTMKHTESVPIKDLFTYYAMIANSWKRGEKSLLSILENFLNEGIIKEFHDYIALIDRSGLTLNPEDINEDDILPYLAPYASPYRSYFKYILYRNPITRKVLLMKRLVMDKSNSDEYTDDEMADIALDSVLDDVLDFLDTETINNYRFEGEDIDTNYFPTGRVSGTLNTVSVNTDSGTFRVTYDAETKKISYIQGPQRLEINELIPMRKVEGVMMVDSSLLKAMINNKLNPC